MRNVIRRALLRPGQNDRGAVGVLVAVLIAAGVLFGMAAVVVDLGETYTERAQLQNGADAGALALAEACATGSEECSDSAVPTGTAGTYAYGNSTDLLSAVDLVCGYDADQPLVACPPATGTTESRVDCPDLPPSDTQFVDVHTSTLTEDGTTVDPRFGHALNGDEPDEGTTVGACARAVWGPRGPGGQTIPLTISSCEWQAATGYDPDNPESTPNYAPSPPYPPDPDSSYSRILRLHDPTEDSSSSGNIDDHCVDDKAVDAPGMFGWIDDPDKDCSAEFEGETYGSDPGADVSGECKKALRDARDNRTPIFIPTYSEVNGTGATGEYTWDGWAAFIITGYHLPGFKAPDWLNPDNKCTGAEKCVYGFFIGEELMPGGGTIGGPDRGVSIIKLTG